MRHARKNLWRSRVRGGARDAACARCTHLADGAGHSLGEFGHALRPGGGCLAGGVSLRSEEMLMLLCAEEVLGEHRRVNVGARAHACGLDGVLQKHRDAQQEQWRACLWLQALVGLCLDEVP